MKRKVFEAIDKIGKYLKIYFNYKNLMTKKKFMLCFRQKKKGFLL